MKPSRRDILKAMVASAAAASTPSVAQGATPRWNVLVLCADEHHAGAMGVEGHPDAYTPNLDALASEGAMLDRCYVSSPVCAPTRQSWLTGLHPEEHGQMGNQYVFDGGNSGLPEVFQALGYDTACFGKLHTRSGIEGNGAFGFDRVLNQNTSDWSELRRSHRDKALGTFTVPTTEDWSTMPFSGFSGRSFHDPALVPDWVLTQEATSYVEQSRTNPFFCYLSLRAPHYPFWLPSSDYGLFDPADVTVATVASDALAASPGGQRAASSYNWAGMSETENRLVLARYLDSVAFADRMFGLILSALSTAGLAENTLVVYLSDHGDMMGEKGLWLKNVAFEGATRKPAILRMPGVIPKGIRLGQLVSEVDLLPTVIGLAGGQSELPTGLSGKDLSEALLLEAHGVPSQTWARSHGVRARTHTFSSNFHNSTSYLPWMRVVQDERYKLVRYETRAGKKTYELYDLESDPSEETNLADSADSGAIQDELEAALDDHVDQLRDPEFTPKLAA
jgi:arylsulfatase A-like enzyme